MGSSAILVAGLLAASGCDKEGEPKPPSSKVESPATPEAPAKPEKPATPEREPADIYGAPPRMDDGPEKPEVDEPRHHTEPVRSIYAGPPPRDPQPEIEPKPEPEPSKDDAPG